MQGEAELSYDEGSTPCTEVDRMASKTLIDRQAQGSALLGRITDADVTEGLRPFLADFQAAHQSLGDANQRLEEAQKQREKALKVVGEQDEVLDQSLDKLADAMVGEGLGERINPFGMYGERQSLSEIKRAPYSKQVTATRALLDGVAEKNPAGKAAEVAAQVRRNVDGLDMALQGLHLPSRAAAERMAERDAVLLEWDKAWKNLRRKATGELDELRFKVIFAAPEAIHRPKTKRKTPDKA